MTTPDAAAIAAGAAALAAGRLVAFPTETVYGLGASALDPVAVAGIFAAKGRPTDHPLICHLASADDLAPLVAAITPDAAALADAFWPGPLTLVMHRSAVVPDAVTGGRDTVAVRVPAHPLALALIGAFGGPVAAPSANRFGRPSPTRAQDVLDDLGDAVAAEASGPARAPGMLESHYAPGARVEVLGDIDAAMARARDIAEDGGRVGLIATGAGDTDNAVTVLAAPTSPDDYAARLYAAFRRADAQGVDVILAVPPPAEGIGVAVRDRLARAAAGR